MENFILFIISVLGGLIFTYLAKFLAVKLKFVSKPNPIVPQHIKPIAYLGGLGIFGGFIFAILYFFLKKSEFRNYSDFILYWKPIMVGLIGFLILGIFDDLRVFKPHVKLFLQISTSIVCVLLGLKVSFTAIHLLDVIFTVFWIVFMVNVANLIDVCDGLLAGIISIIFLVIGLCFPTLSSFCFIIAGSTIGFLFFNFPPASIFLGDAGSHLLGFLLAVIGILQSSYLPRIDGMIWMILITAVPIFEILFITTMRLKQGIPWWQGSSDHFSLRLQSVGYSKIKVNFISWSVTLICALFGYYYLRSVVVVKIFIVGVVGIFFIVIWQYLSSIKVQRSRKI